MSISKTRLQPYDVRQIGRRAKRQCLAAAVLAFAPFLSPAYAQNSSCGPNEKCAAPRLVDPCLREIYDPRCVNRTAAGPRVDELCLRKAYASELSRLVIENGIAAVQTARIDVDRLRAACTAQAPSLGNAAMAKPPEPMRSA